MKPLETFPATTSALADMGRPARAETLPRTSSDTKGARFRDTLAQIQPATTATSSRVQVQRGDTLTSLSRKYLNAQGQTATASDVHRLAMSVAKNNRLANPDLIHAGQKLDFSGARSSLHTPNASAPPAAGASLTNRPAQAQPTLPQAPGDMGKVAIVGDSIAVGIGGALLERSGITPEFAPGRKFLAQAQGSYVVDATGGHSSPQILERLHRNPGIKNAELAIISVGTNDFVNSTVNGYYTPERITRNLQRIRSELNAKERIWVLPYDPKARELVQSVAREHGDKTIDLAQFQPADRYHPRNYSAIASSLSPLLTAQQAGTALAQGQEDRRNQPQAWVSTQNVLLARNTRL